MTKRVSLQNYDGSWLPFNFAIIKIIMHFIRRSTLAGSSSVVQLVEILFHMHNAHRYTCTSTNGPDINKG